jgi:hypothetical protein
MLGWDIATVVVADHGNVPYTVDLASNGRPLVDDGSNRTLALPIPTADDLVGVRIVEIETFVKATPSAVVEKLNGNQNKLTITVIEEYQKGFVKIVESFMINNNAAGTYTVGEHKVYVDTKGNTQIRECYIVK